VDLSRFNNRDFDRGASRVKEALWVLIRFAFFASSLPWPTALRVFWLRRFGARVGQGVVVRSRVNIWFPWRLELGDHVWLGEEVFILNLAPVVIESNVCISQRAFLCTGNHDYTSPTFDLITKPIRVEQGSWIGATAFVGPGVTVGSHAVLSAGSVVTKSVASWMIVAGNPAREIKRRELRAEGSPPTSGC
jgi:putative colanic acid biosynthesis acetyltransferase WcaF